MNFRITDDGDARDIHEIYGLLKAYNLSRREASQNVPIGVFLEDEADRKLAGLTGETFGNWLCIQFLLSANSSGARGSEASCFRPRRKRPENVAANSLCGHLFLLGTCILQKA